jgi:hypothetical protein
MRVYRIYDDETDGAEYFVSKREALRAARERIRGGAGTVWVTHCTISPGIKGRALILALLNREGVMSEQIEVATLEQDP